ncbi:MAG: hypothetical protein WC718_13430 [Phycisphaerales bacterium]|jgi:hypothetical protein
MNFTLFDPGPPGPKNDAAPLAGGAGVNGQNTPAHSTFARLLLVPPTRRNAPETSREAARRIVGHAPTQRAAVLAFIVGCGEHGATDPEIAAGVGIPIQSVNPRRGELAADVKIVLSGRYRLTPSKRRARVWVAAQFAPPAPAGEGGGQ